MTNTSPLLYYSRSEKSQIIAKSNLMIFELLWLLYPPSRTHSSFHVFHILKIAIQDNCNPRKLQSKKTAQMFPIFVRQVVFRFICHEAIPEKALNLSQYRHIQLMYIAQYYLAHPLHFREPFRRRR